RLSRRRHRCSALFPYTTLFRSLRHGRSSSRRSGLHGSLWSSRTFFRTSPPALSASELRPVASRQCPFVFPRRESGPATRTAAGRSEEHTSELQSRENLVCRLLL